MLNLSRALERLRTTRLQQRGTTALSTGALRVSATLELGTGVALLVIPDAIIRLLIGSPSGGQVAFVGRILGGGLVALGITGLPRDGQPPTGGVVNGFVSYNTVTALLLTIAGISGDGDGVLLWPAVAEHAVAAALIANPAPARQIIQNQASHVSLVVSAPNP